MQPEHTVLIKDVCATNRSLRGQACAVIISGMRERWGETFEEHRLTDLVQDDNHGGGHNLASFLVAVVPESLKSEQLQKECRVIGTGALLFENWTQHESNTVQLGRIVRMSVVKEWRRMGVAKKILEQLILRAKEKGMHVLLLETTSSWKDAIAFYLNNGFTELGNTRDEEGFEDTHFYLVLSDLSEGERMCVREDELVDMLKKHLAILD